MCEYNEKYLKHYVEKIVRKKLKMFPIQVKMFPINESEMSAFSSLTSTK